MTWCGWRPGQWPHPRTKGLHSQWRRQQRPPRRRAPFWRRPTSVRTFQPLPPKERCKFENLRGGPTLTPRRCQVPLNAKKRISQALRRCHRPIELHCVPAKYVRSASFLLLFGFWCFLVMCVSRGCGIILKPVGVYLKPPTVHRKEQLNDLLRSPQWSERNTQQTTAESKLTT